VACASAPPLINAVITATATSVFLIESSFRWAGFVWRVRCDRKRVHRVRDQVTDAVHHSPMAGEARHPEEVLGHDRHGKVPGTACGSRVADVLRAVVADLEG
jgi:hypothetical protein